MADSSAEPPKQPPAPQPLGEVGTNQQLPPNPLNDRRRRFAEMVSGPVEPIGPPPPPPTGFVDDRKVHVVRSVNASNPQPIEIGAVNVEAGKPELGTPALTENVSRARTVVGRAVLLNFQTLQFAGITLLAAIDDAIDKLKQPRHNDDDTHNFIDELEELKRRVKEFLSVASAFVANNGEEKPVAEARRSFTNVALDIWEKRHLQIADWTMLTSAATILSLTGPVPAIVAGTVLGGSKVADVLKAFFEAFKSDKS